MARLLSAMKWSAIGSIAAVSLAVAGVSEVSANATGPWTGYADGHITGAAGVEIDQGMAAMHYYNDFCDPAGSWPYGTGLAPTSPFTSITLYSGSGNSYPYGLFTVEDIGDRNCRYNGNYWADIYFGRYQVYYLWYPNTTGQNGCFCNNGGSGSSFDTCWSSSWPDNCQSAVTFGRQSVTYNYYFP